MRSRSLLRSCSTMANYGATANRTPTTPPSRQLSTMALSKKLHQPWMIAVWPGMGHVAISAGYYLLAKLEMEMFAELSPHGLFEVECDLLQFVASAL